MSGRRGRGEREGRSDVGSTARRTEEEDGAGVVAERINESDVHVYCGFEEGEEICFVETTVTSGVRRINGVFDPNTRALHFNSSTSLHFLRHT